MKPQNTADKHGTGHFERICPKCQKVFPDAYEMYFHRRNEHGMLLSVDQYHCQEGIDIYEGRKRT
jgi:hypothetical protein